MKLLTLLFIRLHYSLNLYLGYNIKGLGFAQRFINKDYRFKFKNKLFYYNPKIEGSYDYLLIGKPNEPETHLFFDKLIPQLKLTNFIDVGASIGEFVFSVSNYSNVNKIFALEPRPDCAMVLRKNCELNNETRITVFEKAVSNNVMLIDLHLNAGGSSSGLYSLDNSEKTFSVQVETVLLDDILPEKLTNPIILVDIEGAEPLALEGGKTFIENNKPLIIFEYNLTSKQHFHVNDIQKILGDSYKIYRMKGDGTLDNDLVNTWNCVAIPKESEFEKILIS